jgi:RND family efflux transporter MFP subunit
MPEKSLKARILKGLMPVGILAAGVAAGAVVYTSKPPVEETPPEIKPRAVKTMAVEKSSVSMTIASQGTVAARQVVSLVPQVSGVVSWVSDQFVNGGVFSQGETILEIDPRDYELAVISAEADVADATQQLETAKAQSELAASDWNLLDRGTPSALALRKPQLEGAQARLKSAEAALLKARLMLERTVIRAPYNVIITNKAVDLGQYVGAGTPLGEVSSHDDVEIRLSLPEREFSKIDTRLMTGSGLDVVLSSLSGNGEKTWHGTVVRQEGKIDERTRNIVVIARLEGDQLVATDGYTRLNLGQFVRAEIAGRDLSHVYELPRVALHNGDSVYIVDNENRLRERRVTIIDADDETIWIAEGLEEGDVVTTSPLTSGVEGSVVVNVDNQSAKGA